MRASGLALLILLLGAGCGGGAGVGADGTVSSTTGRSDGRPPASPSSAPAVVTTSTPDGFEGPSAPRPAEAPALDAEGAVLALVADGGPRTFGVEAGCEDLSDQAVPVECAVVPAAQGALAWLVEKGPETNGGQRVTVWRLADGRARPVLEAVDPEAQQWSDVNIEAADLDGEPGSELVVGFRLPGSGAFLELDVVGGDGTVLFHRSLDHGRARIGPGTIEDWSARFGAEDPNCCPRSFVRERAVPDGRSWRIGSSAEVPAAAVPAGQFP